MKQKKYEHIRNALKEYRLLQNELKNRTEYIRDFKKILINPLPKSEETLRKIYNNVISQMEKKAMRLENRLKLLEGIIDRLSGPERNVLYYRYIKGIEWINMPEYMMYEQRTCQLFETKALEKILKMDIEWSDTIAD